MRKYFVFQANEHDCGFASLKILLAIAFKDKAYLSLAKPLDQKEYFSYFDLCQIAGQQGVSLNAYEVETKEQLLLNKNYPLLVGLSSSEKEMHLVVLRKMTKKYVYLIDPQIGYLKMKINVFFDVWNKTVLMIEEKHQLQQIQINKPIVCPKQETLLVLLQIFSSFFGILCLMFVSQESFFIYPLLFFLLWVISELLFRRYQFKVLKSFDENYLIKTFQANKYERKESYINFFHFKKLYFLRPQLIISSSILVVFILFILTLNNIFNLLFCGLLFLFALIVIIYETNFSQKHLRILEKLEKEVFSDGFEKEDEFSHYQKIIDLTYLLSKNETLKKYLGLFLCGVFALLLAAFSFEAKLNYFLFHFFAYYLFLEKVNELLKTLFQSNELSRLKAQFIDKYID